MDVLSTMGGALATPQTERAKPEQVRNSAGGFSFALDDEARLRRFVTLGVDQPTYYATEHALALDNVAVVARMVADETAGLAAVRIAVEISEAGRAKQNEPALWVLAAASGSAHLQVRRAALDALPLVARTGTHLFTFLGYVEKHRRWGRMLRRAVGRWYTDRSAASAALQVVKYRQRAGWTHRDALRLSHGHSGAGVDLSAAHREVLAFACGQPDMEKIRGFDDLRIIDGYLRVTEAGDELTAKEAARLATDYRLPREALPTRVLSSPLVWDALLPHMGIHAMVRNLPTMTRVGLLTQTSEGKREVIRRITDHEALRKARVHPVQALIAAVTYAAGQSVRGDATWTPVQQVVDVLGAAFYGTFGAVTPTGKRIYLALDTSASMGWHHVIGLPGMSAATACAALALVTANVESDYVIRGFSHQMVDVRLSPRMRLDHAVTTMLGVPMGGTDCALPVLDAGRRGEKFDVFVILTDGETHSGGTHPYQALRAYREKTGIPARMVAVSTTAAGFSITDPADAGTLDVVGFDSATPEMISAFARGEF